MPAKYGFNTLRNLYGEAWVVMRAAQMAAKIEQRGVKQ
jgi:hypothetical protein